MSSEAGPWFRYGTPQPTSSPRREASAPQLKVPFIAFTEMLIAGYRFQSKHPPSALSLCHVSIRAACVPCKHTVSQDHNAEGHGRPVLTHSSSSKFQTKHGPARTQLTMPFSIAPQEQGSSPATLHTVSHQQRHWRINWHKAQGLRPPTRSTYQQFHKTDRYDQKGVSPAPTPSAKSWQSREDQTA